MLWRRFVKDLGRWVLPYDRRRSRNRQSNAGASPEAPHVHAGLWLGLDALEPRVLLSAASPAEYEPFPLDGLAAAIEAPLHDTQALAEGDLGVQGSDDRVVVNNTTVSPWSSIGRITVEFKDGTVFNCSGVLISPNHFLTAGHCVYDPNHRGLAKSATVSIARNGSQTPYGQASSESIYVSPGWRSNQSFDHDWALVTLDRNVGNSAGYFDIQALSTATFSNLKVDTAGYPSDITAGGKAKGTAMFRASGRINSATSNRVLFSGNTGLDVGSGQSGSPLFRTVNGTPTVVAIVSTAGTSFNGGTRLTAARVSTIFDLIGIDHGPPVPVNDTADLVDFDSVFDDSRNSVSAQNIQPGQPLEVDIWVRNNGDQPAGPFVVQFRLSTDADFSAFDTVLGQVEVDSLGALSSRKVTLNTTVPDLPPRDYFVVWRIDFGNRVSEADESNNNAEIRPSITVLDGGGLGDDPYESDDTPATAQRILTDGSWQYHSFPNAADRDWVFFQLNERSNVVIETTGEAGGDTMLSLRGPGTQARTPDGPVEDDDSGTGRYAKLPRRYLDALDPGKYWVRIAGAAPIGRYGVRVTAEPRPLPVNAVRALAALESRTPIASLFERLRASDDADDDGQVDILGGTSSDILIRA